MRAFTSHQRLVKVVKNVMAEQLVEQQLADLRHAFARIDLDNTHTITVGELSAMLHALGHTDCLSAVAHCHAAGVVHRDLKPENILFKHRNACALKSELQIIDFGLSALWNDDDHMHSIVGTVEYMAPELLRRDYTSSADMWSVGVILYILLSGRWAKWSKECNYSCTLKLKRVAMALLCVGD